MSDTEKVNNPKTGATGAAWSDGERIAYLLLLIGGQVDAKIAATPIPAGRSTISCKKMIVRLKNTYKDQIEAIKAGTAIDGGEAATPKRGRAKASKAAAEGDGDGDNGEDATPTKKKATPKRKTSVKAEDGDGTPKKRGRKNKGEAEKNTDGEPAATVVKAEDGDGDEGFVV